MAVPSVSQIYNPITGVFGTGQVQFFSITSAWTVPSGINKCRVRLWGGGAFNSGGGGGFSLRVIWDLTGVIAVPVTVGAGGVSGSVNGGTSSFGSYLSATGGTAAGGAGGAGSGGDLNYTGGAGNSTGGGGGGVAGLFGNGGAATNTTTSSGNNGCSGGGAAVGYHGGNGFLGQGGGHGTPSNQKVSASSGLENVFSIDFIGCGGAGSGSVPGINGGGAGASAMGGFPGGGGGASRNGANGLVIVEW